MTFKADYYTIDDRYTQLVLAAGCPGIMYPSVLLLNVLDLYHHDSASTKVTREYPNTTGFSNNFRRPHSSCRKYRLKFDGFNTPTKIKEFSVTYADGCRNLAHFSWLVPSPQNFNRFYPRNPFFFSFPTLSRHRALLCPTPTTLPPACRAASRPRLATSPIVPGCALSAGCTFSEHRLSPHS